MKDFFINFQLQFVFVSLFIWFYFHLFHNYLFQNTFKSLIWCWSQSSRLKLSQTFFGLDFFFEIKMIQFLFCGYVMLLQTWLFIFKGCIVWNSIHSHCSPVFQKASKLFLLNLLYAVSAYQWERFILYKNKYVALLHNFLLCQAEVKNSYKQEVSRVTQL